MCTHSLTKDTWCRPTQVFLHGSLNLCAICNGFEGYRHCNERQNWTGVGHEVREAQQVRRSPILQRKANWTGVGHEVREELQTEALDALSLRNIRSRRQNNKNGVKSQATRKRGARDKLVKSNTSSAVSTNRRAGDVRRSVVAQTILQQPETWHKQDRSERHDRYRQRGHVAHCPVAVLERVRGDVAPRVDVHEATFAVTLLRGEFPCSS